MNRLDELMAGTMSRQASASGMFGDELTLYNWSNVNADPTDAADWEKDDGTTIEGHIDWQTTDDVVSTVGGEEVRADANLYIPERYDVRDGRGDSERASVVVGPDGNEFRVENARVESGVYVCAANLRTTFEESFG